DQASVTEAVQYIAYLYAYSLQLYQYGLLNQTQAYSFLEPVVRAYNAVVAARYDDARRALSDFTGAVQALASSGRVNQQVAGSLVNAAQTASAAIGGSSSSVGATPLFSDDFESYAESARISGGSNGFSWYLEQSDASGGD